MESKPMLVMYIVAYLFIASVLFSMTYGTTTWGISDAKDTVIFEANFTEDQNISDMNIDVISGAWDMIDGNLTATSANNKFIILNVDYSFWADEEVVELTYDLYDINSMTWLITRYVEGLVTDREGYVELDPFEDVINLVSVTDSWFDWLDKTVILGSASCDLTGIHDIVVLKIEQPVGTSPRVWITVNGITIFDGLDVPSFEGFNLLGLDMGVYAQNSGLKINSMSQLEVIDPEESIDLLGSISLIVSILFFVPPDIVMPFWLNFLAFKLPLFGVAIIGYEMIRGI